VVLLLGLVGCVYGFYQSVLPNLRVVRVGVLWRSGQPSALGLHLARLAGIKTIVCLRDGTDDLVQAETAFAKRNGILFVQNQLRYSGEGIDTTVARFLQLLGDPNRQPLLVHCSRGKERTGVCAAVFRMELDGWTNERALREMYALGFKEDTLPELERFVATYEPHWAEQKPALTRVDAGTPRVPRGAVMPSGGTVP
jgi:protein tyrosine/serine phosphatase